MPCLLPAVVEEVVFFPCVSGVFAFLIVLAPLASPFGNLLWRRNGGVSIALFLLTQGSR